MSYKISRFSYKNKKIAFFFNSLQYFYSHRLGLAKTYINLGFKVFLIYGEVGNIDIEKFQISEELILIQCPFNRGSINPINELNTILNLFLKIKNLNLDIIHFINLKPYLYGGLIAKFLSLPSVSSITGMGFANKAVNRSYVLRSIITFILKFVLNRSNHKIIVQNNDDRLFLIKDLNVNRNKITLIKGTGINFEKYKLKNLPPKPYIVIFPGRLIKEKGIYEFIEAAKIVKKTNKDIKFWLVGNIDNRSRSSINKADILKWESEETIIFKGYKKNIANIFSKAHIICLPSYQEGFPRVLVEAAACGRAIITTNAPGCRESILNYKTGILVNKKNAQELAKKILWLLSKPDKLSKMSLAGRKFAEKYFQEKDINQKHILLYDSLLKD